MADNVETGINFSTVPPNTTFAADEIGGVKYPREKLTFGDDGVATDVSSTNPLPVTLANPGSLPTGAATEATLETLVTQADFDTHVGSLTETAPATDTAASGLNGRLQRVAQRLSSLIALLPTALGAGGGLKVDGSGTSLPVTASAGTNLNTSALALETGGNLATLAGTVSSSKMATKAASGDFADGSLATIGLKADARSTATDTTAITAMQVWKQISASVQAIATSIAGTLTVAAHAITNLPTTVDTNSGVKSASTLRVVLATDQPQLTNKLLVTPDANSAVNNAQINGVTPLMGNGVTGTGSQRVTIASDNTAFGVNANQSGTWTVQPGNTANTTPWLTSSVPVTSGGPTVQRVKAAASTNATSVKASAGQIYGWALFNNTATAKFFKVYNKASAPTVGTDTPAFTVIIPASGGTNISWDNGLPLGTGIAFAITGAVADSDTTSTAADDVHGVVLYK